MRNADQGDQIVCPEKVQGVSEQHCLQRRLRRPTFPPPHIPADTSASALSTAANAETGLPWRSPAERKSALVPAPRETNP